MKPILKYRGGKSKEIKFFNKYIPTYNKYYEPFIGGGALFFHEEPRNACINDINKALIQFYTEVQNNFKVLRQDLDKLDTLYQSNREKYIITKMASPEKKVYDPNEDLYYAIRDMYNGKIKPEYTFGAIYYFINKTSYSGMIRYNKKGEFNVPYGRYANFNTQLLNDHHHKLLRNSVITNNGYISSFDAATSEDFVFIDPPYDTTFTEYGNDVFTGDFKEQEHRKLAQDFKNLSSKAMIVIGKTPLTTELYNEFIIETYKKSYSVNIRNRFKSEAEHIVITNY